MTEVVTRAVGIAFAALRSGIQYVVAGLLGWLASIGISLDAEQSKIVEIIVGAVVFAAVVAAIRWMETLRGDGWQRWVRRLGTILMAGTSVLQPSYSRTVDGEVARIVATTTWPASAGAGASAHLPRTDEASTHRT